jgi:hypothetical protein
VGIATDGRKGIATEEHEGGVVPYGTRKKAEGRRQESKFEKTVFGFLFSVFFRVPSVFFRGDAFSVVPRNSWQGNACR